MTFPEEENLERWRAKVGQNNYTAVQAYPYSTLAWAKVIPKKEYVSINIITKRLIGGGAVLYKAEIPLLLEKKTKKKCKASLPRIENLNYDWSQNLL